MQMIDTRPTIKFLNFATMQISLAKNYPPWIDNVAHFRLKYPCRIGGLRVLQKRRHLGGK